MLTAITNILFPPSCYGCNSFLQDNEYIICTDCRHELPLTNVHFENADTVKKVLYGRVHLEQATSLFRFQKKGIVQQLIHNLKYRGYEQIGDHLGQWLGQELSSLQTYKTIDAVIPVPLHKRRQRKRGYNQVAKFAQRIAEAIQASYINDVLIKTNATSSQVFKNRMSRWGDKGATFSLQNPTKIENKHLLLVDDLITTGATVEACANELLKAKNVKISLATIAIA